MLDLKAALKAKGLSERQAGVEVLTLWKRRKRQAEYPDAPSIAAKLGLLRKGSPTWWINQPDALASLAELLGCSVDDLIPEGSGRPSSFAFREFPELAGLLPGQDPCAVRRDVGWLGSFADAALHQGSHAWIVALSGAGKSLAVRALRQRYGSRIVAMTARRLFDAAREAKDNIPLLVEVDGVDPASDHGALIELTKRNTNVCVLAPFRRSSLGAADSRWADLNWTMDGDWRERLVRWAHARLPKPEEFDTEEILDWLSVIDPHGRLFQTPGHLLPLLARAYRAGLPKGPNALRDLGRESLGQVLGAGASSWVRREGSAALEQLMRTRLERLDMALAPLPAEQWAGLLPAFRPSPATPVAAARPRKKAGRVAPTPDDAAMIPTPLQAIHLLEDAGVLRASENGGLDAAAWIRVGIERDAITRQIKSGGGQWALWAVDHRRKDPVDDALGVLSPAELLIAAQRALDGEPKQLATVAAVEAVFAAIGRRMMENEWEPHSEALPVLQELGKRQLALLAAVPKVGTVMPLLPLTRNRPGFDDAWQAQWLAEAWTYSLAVKAPAALKHDPGWGFPGWSSKLRLADAPKELPWPISDTAEGADACERLVRVARCVVRACSDASAPDDVPYLALPWVVIDGPARGWTLSPRSGELLVHSKLGNIVGHLLRDEPKSVREGAAELAWLGVLHERSGSPLDAISRMRTDAPILASVVEDSLPPETFAAAFTAEVLERHDLGKRLLTLPSRLLRAMLPAVAHHARSARHPISEVAPAVSALGREDLDLLVEFVADKYNVGVIAAGRVWTLDSDRALHEAGAALRRNADNEAYAWFHSAPRERYAGLLDVLNGVSVSAVSWATRWLAEVLPVAGAEAPRVFTMIGQSTACS